MGLFRIYVEWFKLWGMVTVAMVPPYLIGCAVGRYIAKLCYWNDHLLMFSCFFVFLAAEVYVYDRFQHWRFFRKLKP